MSMILFIRTQGNIDPVYFILVRLLAPKIRPLLHRVEQ